MDGVEFRPVTIIHTQDDTEWCTYIKRSVPQEKLHLRIETLVVDDLVYENPPELQVSVVESHVVLLLASSSFIGFMEKTAAWLAPMLKKGDQEVTTIVMAKLCISDEDIQGLSDSYAYATDKWEITEIDTSGKNIQTFIGRLLDIFDQNKEKRISRQKGLKKTPSERSDLRKPVMIPTSVQGPGEKVALLFKDEIKGKITVRFKHIKTDFPTEEVNPYCVMFESPDTSQDIIPFQVHMDGARVGILKLENKKGSSFTSLEMLCQVHGVASTEELDKILAEKFNQSMCHDGYAVKVFDGVVESDLLAGNLQKDNKHPTLIHWAAANGLCELCSALLPGPGAEMACNIENCDKKNPEDLARDNGHLELADLIYQFNEMKCMADQCDLYVQTCKQEMALRSPQDDYETMTASPIKIPSTASPPVPPRRAVHTSDETYYSEADQLHMTADQFLKAKVEPYIQPGAVGSRNQSELIAIQEEVKSGNFTLHEAEMLFRAWQQRNQAGSTVSFRARQQALGTLRTEYSKTFNVLQSANKQKKKPKKLKEAAEEEELFGAMSISEPYQTRNPGAKGTLPRGGRSSNTSVSSGASWRSSDSGRASAISHTSVSSEDFEFEESAEITRCGSSNSSQRREEKAESRKSSRELYLEVLADSDAVKALPPPVLPPRPKRPSIPPKGQKPPPIMKKSGR